MAIFSLTDCKVNANQNSQKKSIASIQFKEQSKFQKCFIMLIAAFIHHTITYSFTYVLK